MPVQSWLTAVAAGASMPLPTGIAGDTRSFAVLAPVDLMSPAWAAASRLTGNPADGGVIELYPVTEKPSDVPAANFVPWTN
jgi:hypothetical protein